jgi:hypothetical protein
MLIMVLYLSEEESFYTKEIYAEEATVLFYTENFFQSAVLAGYPCQESCGVGTGMAAKMTVHNTPQHINPFKSTKL